MKQQTKKTITDAMVKLLYSRNEYLQCEAARLLCAIDNVFVSEGITNHQASGRVSADFALARQQLAEKFTKKRAQRQAANRRNYLRRRLRALQAVQITPKEENEKEAID